MFLYTGEQHSRYRYTREQLGQQIMAGRVLAEEKGPPLFIIGPEFVRQSMQGRFAGTQILIGGCDSLSTPGLATGAFSPLDRFMGRADYQRVLDEMRLADGTVFPIPVTLPVEPGAPLHLDQDVALRNPQNEVLAVMTVEDLYPWDLAEAAHTVFGTLDPRHPLVAEMQRWGPLFASGRLRVLQLPRHYDFRELRLTPAQTRAPGRVGASQR